jgi:hypothetical protein
MQKEERLHSAKIAGGLFKGLLYKTGIVALLGGSLALVAPASAVAGPCEDLGGSIVSGECQVNATVTRSGSFSLAQTLHLLSNGKILTNGENITINVAGNIVLDAGAVISADDDRACPAGKAGDITLTTSGDVITALNSHITANSKKCDAGDIRITADGETVDIAGNVKSVSTASGSGIPGGGQIIIDARCDLDISGMVTSKGDDPGADLVHLEGGCQVKISGMVQSTGNGHANPGSHCHAPGRPDKPGTSAACIEVWAGDSLEITGEVDADLRRSGPGTSWIDLFARGIIQITGGVAGDFAVHANGTGASDEDGGDITVVSILGSVVASGRALQADATTPGSDGGTITIRVLNDVDLDTAELSARGDFNPMGGLGTGGAITVRAFHMALIWTNGDGNVEPSGTFLLTRCTSADLTGTVFNDPPPPPSPAPVPGVNCVGNPVLQPYVILPDCPCPLTAPCVCLEDATRSGNLLTIFGGDCAEGFLGDLNILGDETTIVGFSATCEPTPTCTALVNPATRTNDKIEVTVPACAVPGNFIIVGIDGPSPNPTYNSFSCLKAPLQP